MLQSGVEKPARRIERAISYLVNWKILDLGYRGRPSELADMLRTVTTLEIYRARVRPAF